MAVRVAGGGCDRPGSCLKSCSCSWGKAEPRCWAQLATAWEMGCLLLTDRAAAAASAVRPSEGPSLASANAQSAPAAVLSLLAVLTPHGIVAHHGIQTHRQLPSRQTQPALSDVWSSQRRSKCTFVVAYTHIENGHFKH